MSGCACTMATRCHIVSHVLTGCFFFLHTCNLSLHVENICLNEFYFFFQNLRYILYFWLFYLKNFHFFSCTISRKYLKDVSTNFTSILLDLKCDLHFLWQYSPHFKTFLIDLLTLRDHPPRFTASSPIPAIPVTRRRGPR